MARGIPIRHPGGVYVQPGSPPIVRSIDPATVQINQAATVVITGGGFSPSSVVKLDGNDLIAPTFIDDTHISVAVPSFATPVAMALTVTTGALDSNAVTYRITL